MMNNIEKLPSELIQMIYSNLTIKQRLMLGSSCLQLYLTLKENMLFKVCSKKLKYRRVKLNQIVPKIANNHTAFIEFHNIYRLRINHNLLLFSASKAGNLDLIKFIIRAHTYTSDTQHLAFNDACLHQRVNVVSWFIESNIILISSYMFPLVCASGDINLVKRIYSGTVPHKSILDEALGMACKYGHLEIINWFCHDLGYEYELADHFNKACIHGQLDVAKNIYEVCDSFMCDKTISYAYDRALYGGQLYVARWLNTLCDLYTNKKEHKLLEWFRSALDTNNVKLIKHVYDMITNKCTKPNKGDLLKYAKKIGHLDTIYKLTWTYQYQL